MDVSYNPMPELWLFDANLIFSMTLALVCLCPIFHKNIITIPGKIKQILMSQDHTAVLYGLLELLFTFLSVIYQLLPYLGIFKLL